MNAEIIGVGSELLLGQIANTDAQFVSKELAEMGINVYYHTVVGDNADRLREVILQAEKRADLIIFTGGLGPTKDDLTKETVADIVGVRLVYDETAMKQIEEYFVRVNRRMSPNNKKQALVLEGSVVLPNDNGMAPGMALQKGDHIYMMLPGPPRELEPMFSHYGKAYLEKTLELRERIESRVLRFFGIGESQLETDIIDLIENQTNPTIAPLAADGEVTLRLTAKHSSKAEAHRMIDELETQILDRVGAYFYGYDDASLFRELFQSLEQRHLTIASAESLTGGLFAEKMTQFPGASDVVVGGVVSYTNEVKKRLLHVSDDVLRSDGAVSEACARLMAENVRSSLGADIGISFTGVAGPSTSEGKPVGTVYIGIAMKGKDTVVHHVQLAGSREAIRARSAKQGCYFLLRMTKFTLDEKV